MRSSKTRAGRFSLSAWLGAGSGLLALGCGGPSVGDIGAQEIVFSVGATASKPKVAALGDAKGGLGVTRAFISASDVDLTPCLADAHDIALGARGYDLLAPPPSEAVETAVTEYCGLRVDIAAVSKNTAHGVPTDAALYVEGQDASGNAFSVSSPNASSLSFTLTDGSSFGDPPFLIGFDVSVWLAGLPLPGDMADASAALLDSQLPSSAALYVDSNGNGALDADEQTPIAQAEPAR